MKNQNNLGTLRNEIVSLKSEITKINKEKENWFKEKEELKKNISDLINKIKTVKGEKDSFNVVFKDLKNKRDEFNNQVKKLISEIKILRKERKLNFKKLGITLDPEKIREKIKKLETYIETEILSLKKEEVYMGEIKSLKKSLSESKVVTEIDRKIDFLSKQIDEAKIKSQECHQKLKEYLKKHKKGGGYKDFISLSKQIDFLKQSQEKAFKMFIDFKNRFISMNKRLKNKIFEERRIKGKFENKVNRLHEEKKKKEEKLLDKKYREVEEKLKMGKKLTTEDLLGGR